jgi:naphthalene 1,2-dioxygenase system ferredoxin subunit
MSIDLKADEWLQVATVGEVQANGTLLCRVGSHAVCLYSVAGAVYATDDTCTHGNASLADGFIEGDCISCPLHEGRFHIPTGRAVAAPCVKDIRTYAVKVKNDGVLLRPHDFDGHGR